MNFSLGKMLKLSKKLIAVLILISLVFQMAGPDLMVYAASSVKENAEGFLAKNNDQVKVQEESINIRDNIFYNVSAYAGMVTGKVAELITMATNIIQTENVVSSMSTTSMKPVVTKTNSVNSFPDSIVYSSNGYFGILQKYGAVVVSVVSGSYTPAHSKYITYSVYTGTTYPASTYYYSSSDGYEGTLNRASVNSSLSTESKNYSRTFYKTLYNTITSEYDAGGNLIQQTSTHGFDNPTYPINEDGYVGSIPKIYGWTDSGPTRTDNADGSYTIKTVYGANYEGTLTKSVEEIVTVYTGNYSGTVTKPAEDTRIYSYTQDYTGTVFSRPIWDQNLGNPPNSMPKGDPVNILTGNFYTIETDLTIPDIGIDLEIIRSYNTLDDRTTMIGKGWHLNYDSVVTEDTTLGVASVSYPDGKTIEFQPVSGTYNYTSPESIFDTLEKKIDGGYELKLQSNQTYVYNPAGKLTAIKDQNGNTITIQYDVNGNIHSVTGQGGKKLTFTYENGKLKTITDPASRTITYTYDAYGNIREVKGLNDGVKKYTYNSYGLITITDENGKVFIENVYDEFKRVVTQYDIDRNISTFTYDTINMENTFTFNGRTEKVKYNDKMYVVKETFDDLTYEEYTYDEWGNRNSMRDRNGNISKYTYDQRGNLLSITSPAPYNYITSFTYDNNDNLKEIKTPGGRLINYYYDLNSNLIKKIEKLDDFQSAETTYQYDDRGRLVKTIDPQLNETNIYYTTEGLPDKIVDPENNIFEFTYDNLGRRVTVTTAYGTTNIHYNKKNKIEKLVDPLGNVTRMKYDAVGNLIKLIQPEQYNSTTDDGIGYSYGYDAMDRLIKETDPLGAVFATKYDMDGNKIKEVNPNYYDATTDNGAGVAYEYDTNQRVIKIVNPSGEKTRIKYDAVGNRIKVINANNYNETLDSGAGIEYIYDTLNRPTTIKDSEDRVIHKYVYDEDGRIIKAIDAKGYLSSSDDQSRYGTTYKYNLAGWLLEKRVPLKEENGTVYYNITRYSYNKNGKVVDERISNDYVTLTGEPINWNVITYTYDKNGRAKTISDSTGSHMEYTYDAVGNVTEEKVKINDTTYNITGYEYDAAGRVIRTWKQIDATNLAETRLHYDKNGNITKVTSPEGYVTDFVYNVAGRLVEKRETVNQHHIRVKNTTASIESSKTKVYQGQTNQFKVVVDPDSVINQLNLEVDYDTRLFTLVGSEGVEGTAVDTSTPGKILISGDALNFTEKTTVATITLMVKDTVAGTGSVLINQASTFTNAEGTQSFSGLTNKTVYANGPDMNDDGKVELDDFSLTALLKNIPSTDPTFDTHYDIDNSNIIDNGDLDYIKDWLFHEKSSKLSQLPLEKFLQKYTTADYDATVSTVDRITTYQYDKAGNLIKETDPNLNTVEYVYDKYNRLISAKDKAGNISRVFYDEVGNRIKEVMPENYDATQDNGSGITYTYDSMNRLSTIKNPQGAVIQKNIYDINGNIVKVIDGKGYLASTTDSGRYGVEYTYDIGNRVVGITTPEAKTNSKTSVSFTYDAQNNILTQQDAEGNITTYERDPWGRATNIIDAEGINEDYQYDFAGNVVMSRDGKGNATYYNYNSLNLVSSITDPSGQTITYIYDKEGRRVKEIDRNGNTINYHYNRDNNLTSKQVEGTQDLESYYYNEDGTLLAAANKNGIDVFEYTLDGYLKRKSRNGETQLDYTYNKNGNVTGVSTMGKTTNYTYDVLGRLETVSEGNSLLATYAYNIDNTISTVTYNTGININYSYDRDKNITSILQKNPQGGVINNLNYTYDLRGNQLSKNENNETTIYTYDKVNRLKTVEYPTAAVESFTYDNAGNRIQKQLGQDITTYEYDSRNRLTKSIADDIITTYDYDNNGNLLAETTGTEITSYTYDGFNRTLEVQKPNGSYQLNHYDAMGLRVGMTENGVHHEFIFSGGNVIGEINSNTETFTKYVRGYGLVAKEDPKGNTNYYLHNQHGDVINLVKGTGEILNGYQYDAFGNTTSYTEKVANRFRYAGEQFDNITGQYYLRARYYNPELGRFTQEDTYRGDGLNLYVYVSNNPIRYVDPSGNEKGTAKNSILDWLKNRETNTNYELTKVAYNGTRDAADGSTTIKARFLSNAYFNELEEMFNKIFDVLLIKQAGSGSTIDVIHIAAESVVNRLMDDLEKNPTELIGHVNFKGFFNTFDKYIRKLNSITKRMHYFRNTLNSYNGAPTRLDDMIELAASGKWNLFSNLGTEFHRYNYNGLDGAYNVKFVSADGRFEAVYNYETRQMVTDPANMGTYNYVPGIPNILGHIKYDVNPWKQWGNTSALSFDEIMDLDSGHGTSIANETHSKVVKEIRSSEYYGW